MNTTTPNLRINNTLYKCILDGKYYNADNTPVYGIGVLLSLVPQEKQVLLNMDAQVICENCWKEHKDNKEGLNLKDPSQIVTATPDILKGLKR